LSKYITNLKHPNRRCLIKSVQYTNIYIRTFIPKEQIEMIVIMREAIEMSIDLSDNMDTDTQIEDGT